MGGSFSGAQLEPRMHSAPKEGSEINQKGKGKSGHYDGYAQLEKAELLAEPRARQKEGATAVKAPSFSKSEEDVKKLQVHRRVKSDEEE